MGQMKKAYLDWCEQNDTNPDDELMGNVAWTEEFERWLDTLASKNPLTNEELNRMEQRHGK